MDKCLYFLVNIICNSFLSFFTASGLIALIVFLLRIRPGRISSILWMIPLYKLPFDLFYYNFMTWAYLHGIDPRVCEDGSRSLTAALKCLTNTTFPFIHISSTLQLDVDHFFTFTFADILALHIPNSALYPLICAVFSLSLYFVSKTIKSSSHEKPIGSLKNIPHRKLSAYCQKKGIQVITTKDPSPYSYGLWKHTICIPDSTTISEKQYLAILAHEIEHCRYKDTLVRYVNTLISAFFWWIPTKWVIQKIEKMQEIGCDSSCIKYSIDPIDLATALYTFAKKSQPSFSCNLAQHMVSKRVELLLCSRSKKIYSILAVIGMIVSFFIVFLGKFWIF